MKKTLSLAILLSIFIFSGGYKSEVMAQTSINLSVSPPISYLQVPPGTTRSHTVVLENTGDKAITVTPSIVDFSSDGKTGRAIISNELSFPYITFGAEEVKELSVPAHKKAQLTLHIDVPKDADEREYPLTILFSSKKDSGLSGIDPLQVISSNSQISGGIGSNLVVLVSKESKLSQALKVVKLNTPRFVDSFGRIEFSPLIKNDSFSSSAASGSAEILNWKKEAVVEFEIYPDIVLGTNSREIRALRLGIKSDKPETGAFSYKPSFLLGPYQIVINLENDQQINSKYIEVIYALPFSIIFIVVIGTIIAVIYYKKVKIF